MKSERAAFLKDNAYTGLAIRNEEVVTAEQSGYINYFVSEASKVGAKTKYILFLQNN